MDKYLEYLESLRQSNPELLSPENRGQLMRLIEDEFELEFDSEESMTGFIANKGFEFPLTEKKNDVQNGDTELDSTLDQPKPSLESQPVQDGMGVVDLTAAQKRSNYISKTRANERALLKDGLFSDITANFLDGDEGEVKIALTKKLLGKGFNVNEIKGGSNAVEVLAPNGKSLEVDLSYSISDRVGDLFDADVPIEAIGDERDYPKDGANRSLKLIEQAKSLRGFLKENSKDMAFAFQSVFDENKTEATKQVFNDIFESKSPYPVSDFLSKINNQISESKKIIADKTYKPIYPAERAPLNLEETEQQVQEATKELNRLEATRKSILDKKNVFSKTISELINNSNSLNNFSKKDLDRMTTMGLDVRDIKLPGIEIDGARSSFNELSSILTDDKLRKAVKDGEIDLKVNSTGTEGYFKELMEEAMALESIQMNAGYTSSVLKELGASALETMDNIMEAAMDVQLAISKPIMKFSQKNLMGGDFKNIDVDAMFDAVYAPKKSLLTQAAEEIREGQLQVEGDMISSESFGELMFKGGKAASQSAPAMAAFMYNPTLGLYVTGMSSYGSSIKDTKGIMDYIKKTGDPTGMYDGYRDMTLSNARTIAASKAFTETAFTYAFTYNFIKGLKNTTASMPGMTRNEGRKLINFYSKGFISNFTKMGYQSVIREIPEEELIVVANMFLDEEFGIADYSMSDYIKSMKNTAASIPFSTLPMTGVAYRQMNKTSKDFVKKMISNYAVDQNALADRNALNQLDFEIDQKGEDKVDKYLLDERDALAKKIVEEENKRINNITNRASDSQIAQMAVIMNDLNSKIKQYASEDQPLMRQKLKEEIERLEKRGNEILESIGIKDPKADVDLSLMPNGKAKKDKIALKIAEKLQEKLESESVDNDFFNENRAKFEEMSEFLSKVTEADLTPAHKKLITEMYSSLNRSQGWHIGFDKYYNRLIGGNKLAGEVLAGRPTTDRIKPMTTLESLFAGFKGGTDLLNMANVNHILSFMFKNDRMGAPVKNLSGKIDANINEVKNNIDAEKLDFSKGGFLKGKVTKKRLENLQSEASMAEMMILSEMTKRDQGEDASTSFSRKKRILDQNKGQLKKYDDSDSGKKTQKTYSDAYNKLLEGSNSLADVYAKANPDVIAAVKYLAESFTFIKDPVMERMENYYGREGTQFDNYIPSIVSTMGQDVATDRNSDAESFVSGPNSMNETKTYDDISQSDKVFLYENWASMVFKSKENLELELKTRDDIDVMKGFLESKTFENMFDTESKSFTFATEGDFAYLKSIINEKLNTIDKSIETLNSARPMKPNSLQDFLNTVTKVATAFRLSTVSMRASQANSAMLAALPIVGSKARKMLVESLIKFNTFALTADIDSNKNFLEVLKKSSTSRRSGATQLLPNAFGDRPVKRKSSTFVGKGFDLANQGLQSVSDKTLDVMLGQSDKIAGQATWAAFYYDRMVQTRGSEIENMNFDQFWAWSKDNTDMNAVAWADSQVDRSQMLSNQWNNGKAFQGKYQSNILFPFGRFAYNRKVGMANDWSIINDDVTATEADKAKAKRRLTSAAIEIGVFKTIQPAVAALVTQSVAGFVSGLVGFDEEYDKDIEIFIKAAGGSITPGENPFATNKFQFSNYELSLGKQFKTSLVEGMTPLPTPSVANEIVFAAINRAAGDEVFNVYSKELRGILDGEGVKPTSLQGIAKIITENAGLATLVAEDASSLYNATFAEVGAMPNPFSVGDTRWVIPQALPAAEFLKEYRKVNLLIQSADLKKLLDKTEKLLQRKYTVTERPDYEAYMAIKDGKGEVNLKQ